MEKSVPQIITGDAEVMIKKKEELILKDQLKNRQKAVAEAKAEAQRKSKEAEEKKQ